MFPPLSQIIGGSRLLLPADLPTCVRSLIVRWNGCGGVNLLQVLQNHKQVSPEYSADVLLAWLTVLPPPTMLAFILHSPTPEKACGSKAALLFKVKLLCHVAFVEFLR